MLFKKRSSLPLKLVYKHPALLLHVAVQQKQIKLQFFLFLIFGEFIFKNYELLKLSVQE